MAYIIPIIAALAETITWAEALFLSAVSLYGDYQRKKAERDSAGPGGISSIERTEMIRSPVAPRVLLYGQSRVSGVITYIKETSSTEIYVLLTLTGHPVFDIRDIQLNDEIVEEDPDGRVIGKFFNVVEILRGLGTSEDDATLVARLQSISGGEWTSDHKQTGCAKLLVRLVYSRNIFPNGIPSITAVVLGKRLEDPRDTSSPTVHQYSANPALAMRDYLLSVDGLGASRDEMDEDSFSVAANVCDEEVAVADGHLSTFSVDRVPLPLYAAGTNRRWGNLYVRQTIPRGGGLTDPRDDINVLYNTDFLTALHQTIRYGITFTDSTGETTPVIGLGDFPAVNSGTRVLCVTVSTGAVQSVVLQNIPLGTASVVSRKIYRYMSCTVPNGGLVTTLNDNSTTSFTDILYGGGAITPGAAPPSSDTTAPASIRLNSQIYLPTGARVTLSTTGTLPSPLATATEYFWIYISRTHGALALTLQDAIDGNAIILLDTGTGVHTLTVTSEYRYTLNGTITADVAPRDVLRAMLTACAGELYYVGGKWTLYAGAYRSPTFTLDENDLDGPVSTTTRMGRRAIFNSVKGVLFSPEDKWQQTDFPPVTNATYLAEDGGERIWSDLELPFTISKATAQRIAKIKLEEVRQQIVTRWPCKITALRGKIGDTCEVTFDRNGWTDKLFRVVDWQLSLRGDTTPRLGIDMVLRETASTIYDWNNGEETVIDPAPDTDLPNPFTQPDAPENLVVIPSSVLQPDGTAVSKFLVMWDQTENVFVLNGGKVHISYRPVDTDTGGSPTSVFNNAWQRITLEGGTDQTEIAGLEAGIGYWISVWFENSVGVESDVTTGQELAAGDETAPADVVGLTFNTPVLTWNENTERDLAGYIVRYALPGSPTVGWDDALPAHDEGFITATEFNALDLLLLDGDDVILYLKAVDYSGNQSIDAASISVTVTDAQLHEFLGSNWVERENAKNIQLNDVIFNGSLYVAVGNADGSDGYILTSTDGIIWIERANPKNINLNGVAWNGSLFVAVGTGDGTDSYIVTSSDGITWAEQTCPINSNLRKVVWNGSLFCAVGDTIGGNFSIVTSTDGLSWTDRSFTGTSSLNGITWNGSIFCAVGNATGSSPLILTSSDGVSWTQQTGAVNARLDSIAWNGSVFCAVGQTGGNGHITTSPDGISWVDRGGPTSLPLFDVTWSGGIFCTVGTVVAASSSPYIGTSRDGETWVRRYASKQYALRSVIWTGKSFLAVGSPDGTDAFIAHSLVSNSI